MGAATRFHVELIKPSHYDDDGFVIQWWKAAVPSNSLACLYAIIEEAGARGVLGPDIAITVSAADECNQIIRPSRVAARIGRAGRGVVFLVGVQSNQFPRAMDLAREFLACGVAVVIGGFHVSGCLSMLPEMPADLKQAIDLGVSLFAGEAEGHVDAVLRDAYVGTLKPVYNTMAALPHLEGQPAPYLPDAVTSRYSPPIGTVDAGRGCPFQCSFCTIINVQGRKSRYRTGDDIEAMIRRYLAQGVKRFLITDDNFARNRNWEAILDRIILLRERDGFDLRFLIQVDALAYRLPGFVEKCRRAGCRQVFIGLESINPANLLAGNKRQNRIGEYRAMFMAWRNAGIRTFCGYILGFPGDTPESIERDIRTMQREMPLDIVEFFILTPLPGSADHLDLYRRGVPMDPDMNKYDIEHVTTAHPSMSGVALQAAYWRAWEQYYSWQHVETLLRRGVASGIDSVRLMLSIVQFRSLPLLSRTHPLQGGYLRLKLRRQRRPGFPRASMPAHAARMAWETARDLGGMAWMLWKADRIRRRILREHAAAPYSDAAIAPLTAEELELMRPASRGHSVAA